MKIESALLRRQDRIVHGFFGREGGVSEGPYASLNVSLPTGLDPAPNTRDDPARVLENRARAAALLGTAAERLVVCRQVHGVACVVVDEPWPPQEPPEADALATTRDDVLLGVTTADCAPILLADAEARVVGAAHAGWRGARDGVVESVVATMVRLGAATERIAAAIGPCLALASFEVGPELVESFRAADPASEPFFRDGRDGGRPRFDLEGYVAMRLARAGVRRVDALGIDTFTDATRFFSFRRTTKAREVLFGTQLSAIRLAG